MTTLRTLAPTTLALAAALAAGSAQAVDFDGYFRAGPGLTSANASRACYNLGISGGHYRLGNECDFYGEFGLTQTGKTEGIDWKGRVMFSQYNPGTDTGDSKTSINQMYVEGKGFDFAPGTNFWIGKRFYGRKDVHILDTFFVKMDGVGGGADQIALGGAGKLGVALFTTDNDVPSNTPGVRVNADLSEIPLNAGGALRVTGTFTKGRFTNQPGYTSAPAVRSGTNGFGLSLQHTQDIASIGGGNTLWLQYAQGSAGLDGNFGDLTAPSGAKKARLVESVAWQVGNFGGQAVALVGKQDDNTLTATPGFTEVSLGGRASYALTKNFKLLAEVGHMEKKPDSGATQKLTKFTFAPAIATGPEFFKRPELRLYVTTAKWNAAANAAAGPNGLTGLNNGKTSGTSFGLQAEIWF